MEIKYIIFLLCYIPYWVAVVRYDVQMFQQNSYREERYMRWLRQYVNLPQLILLVAATIMGIFLADKLWLWSATGVCMAGEAARRLRVVYKKPIVYTNRVKRLLATAAILSAGVLGCIYFINPDYILSAGAALLALPVVMLVANLLNKPLEAAISRWYYNDAKRILHSMPDLKIIGITGSFGKTSTKHYLYRILSEKYNVLMTPGNFNTTLGVVRTIREHLKPHHQVFIVEMGAKQVGDIKEICELVHPQVGVVTAVGEMHLETFRSVENVRRTKFELIDALPERGLAVVNMDSELIASKPIDHKAPLVGYAVKNHDADYRAVDISYSNTATTFDIDCQGDVREGYSTRLVGRGNILNLLAAVAVADHMGIGEAQQKRAMRQIEQIEHRLSLKRTAGGITILDDAYNSNPMGAKMALEVLHNFTRPEGARRIVVTPGFVELGERQADLNRELGRDMAAACDIAIVVNRTNRDAIMLGLQDAEFPSGQIIVADSFAEASATLSQQLRAGDIILYENDLPDSFK
ncbi:MAG: UDP-N-acetylmuramoyl-tripeptide--D-alanyl-D-alanine ligase [Alistipes sp.]|nr:UDP-N-acetylmuramoyl-tripeptide--D-alanyl-D-alanine ligase [Alistipes sp.]